MKKVLFISCFSDHDFSKMISSGIIISQPSQKFNKLFIKGFALNDYDVDVITYVNNECADNLMHYELYNGHSIHYHYCKTDSVFFIKRYLCKKRYVKNFLKEWSKQNPNGLIVIDSLKDLSFFTSLFGHRFGCKVVSIVTDFIDYLGNNNSIVSKLKNKIRKIIFYSQFKYTDVFVLLTEKMRDKLKIDGKKIVVIEGLCDCEACKKVTSIEPNNIILYSGAVSTLFGVDNLVNAFIKANISGFELHIYGTGDYCSELKKICLKNTNVKYFGIVANEQIIDLQKKAFILVNPRPVSPEYTLYSFPSKIIEYMISCRPVLTTKLPGIPLEYNDYLLYFDDDSIASIQKNLIYYCNYDRTHLSEIGKKAFEYVRDNKNNKLQISRLLEETSQKL